MCNCYCFTSASIATLSVCSHFLCNAWHITIDCLLAEAISGDQILKEITLDRENICLLQIRLRYTGVDSSFKIICLNLMTDTWHKTGLTVICCRVNFYRVSMFLSIRNLLIVYSGHFFSLVCIWIFFPLGIYKYLLKCGLFGLLKSFDRGCGCNKKQLAEWSPRTKFGTHWSTESVKKLLLCKLWIPFTADIFACDSVPCPPQTSNQALFVNFMVDSSLLCGCILL